MSNINQYQILINRQQEKFNKFPIKFAFNDEQFKKGMNELGLNENDTDKVVSTGVGGFIRKSDVDAYVKLGEKFDEELKKEIENDKFGNKFVKDMFSYELANHEYGYTQDYTDSLEALGYTIDDINKNSKLKKGFELALAEYSQEIEDEMEI